MRISLGHLEVFKYNFNRENSKVPIYPSLSFTSRQHMAGPVSSLPAPISPHLDDFKEMLWGTFVVSRIKILLQGLYKKWVSFDIFW